MKTNYCQIVGVHLDLKYLMPRKEFLHHWLQEIAATGINTLLLEYEDKFPYQKYPFLSANDAFTPDELNRFLCTARECGLRVMPLVQTLSHLEFALAHEELAHLREAPDILTQINPSNLEALEFVHHLIEEVLSYHEEDEYFHLGADETWFVGTHPDYADEVKEIGVPAYWIKHLKPYIHQVVTAGKRPVAWDDIFWDDPLLIRSLDVPRELVLHSWDYGISEVEETSTSLSRVDVYQEAGFEVIGAPCLNWGVLTPRHDHVLENTAAWAQKVRESQLLGLINTSWAVFHTLLPTQMPYIAATAALLQGDAAHQDKWLLEWSGQHFGFKDERIPGALRDLSLNWSQKIAGLERPITPIVYSYTDLVLHYGSLEKRQKSGAYPLEWDEVNFCELYRTKIHLLRQLEDKEYFQNKLKELQTAYIQAALVFHELERRATSHRAEALLLACFADIKELHVQIIRCLVLGEGPRDKLLLQSIEQKQLLEKRAEPFYEAAGVDMLVKLWCEPACTTLSQNCIEAR